MSAWPGQAPPADYVVNVAPQTRNGEANPQLARWDTEAQYNSEFARLVDLRAALHRRGVRMLTQFDSLFMRLYAARAVIPAHRDEGRPRLRIVGNSGRSRRVHFKLQAVGSCASIELDNAQVARWEVDHGGAYALTDAGAGRCALRADAEPTHDMRMAVAARTADDDAQDAADGLVSLFATHEVQPMSSLAPLTMAWVVDLDVDSCDGDPAAIVRAYESAVFEVMNSHGVTLQEAMEPPELPSPFLYRPLEAGGGSNTTARQPHEVAATQTIDENTRFVMRVECAACASQHWLPAQEGPSRRLWMVYQPSQHAAGCIYGASPIRISPSLRHVCEGYRVRGADSIPGAGVVVGVAISLLPQPASRLASVSLSFSAAPAERPWMWVTACQPVESS